MSDQTPVLTRHAKDRCAEMGISTKVAKRIYRNRQVCYPGTAADGIPTMVALSDVEPDYAIVFLDNGSKPPVVITVLFNTTEYYERAGTTFIPVRAATAEGATP